MPTVGPYLDMPAHQAETGPPSLIPRPAPPAAAGHGANDAPVLSLGLRRLMDDSPFPASRVTPAVPRILPTGALLAAHALSRA